MQKKFHFDCKKCGHEYIHNNDPSFKCPKCGHDNQNNGKI